MLLPRRPTLVHPRHLSVGRAPLAVVSRLVVVFAALRRSGYVLEGSQLLLVAIGRRRHFAAIPASGVPPPPPVRPAAARDAAVRPAARLARAPPQRVLRRRAQPRRLPAAAGPLHGRRARARAPATLARQPGALLRARPGDDRRGSQQGLRARQQRRPVGEALPRSAHPAGPVSGGVVGRRRRVRVIRGDHRRRAADVVGAGARHRRTAARGRAAAAAAADNDETKATPRGCRVARSQQRHPNTVEQQQQQQL